MFLLSDSARLSQKLATIVTTAPITLNFEEATLESLPKGIPALEKYALKNLVKTVQGCTGEKGQEEEVQAQPTMDSRPTPATCNDESQIRQWLESLPKNCL